MNDHTLPAVRPAVVAGGAVAALVPQNIDEAWRLSEAFAKGKILPRGITEPGQVMLIICGGAEVGFGPFQSLQSFALINNRLTMWGDAIPALLWGRGFKIKEWFDNEDPAYPDTMVAKCVVTRPDGTEIPGEFSVADAKEAKLWSKEGPWQTAKKRMMKMRARAFAARDGAADVLRGIPIREEVQDYDDVIEVTALSSAPITLSAEFADQKASPESAKPARRRKAAPEAETGSPAGQEAASAAEGDAAGASGADTQTAAQAASEALAGDDLPANLGDFGPFTGAEGHAEPGEVYILAGSTPDADGRVLTFKDGVRFSSVTLAGSDALAVYSDHSPESVNAIDAEIERAASEPAGDEDDEVEEGTEEEGDDLPAEFRQYIGQVEEANTWVEVKKAMQEFYKTDLFKGMSPGQQNQIRGNTWDAVASIDLPDKPDQATDVSAFRLWVEWVEDPEAIQGTLAVLEGQPTFAEKDPSFKEAIRKAVASRLESLQG